MFRLLPFLALATSTINDCGVGKSLFTITKLSFFPDPPTVNENITVQLGYSVSSGIEVTGGTTAYAITYNFLPLNPTVEDLCTQTTCPLVAGSYTQESTFLFPELSGSVIVTTTWKDLAGRQLLCYKINTKV